MNSIRYVPWVVMGTGVVLAAAVLITLATGDPPDYADLVPAPDEIVWAEGAETAVWLSANRHAVDLQIDSIALGLGDIEERNPGSEMATTLGEGPGCLDHAVTSLTVAHDTGDTWNVSGTIDRGPTSKGNVEVHVRYYRPADQMPGDGTVVDVTVSAGSDDYSLKLIPGDGNHRVQASTDAHFPAPFTRQVDFDTSDTTSGGTVTGESVFHMLENTGLGLIACGEEEDVLITLHGDEGAELNRYYVDVGPAPTATPSPPSFAAYQTKRFCPDVVTPRDELLNGGESVGSARATGTGTITYSLAANGDSNDFAFFNVSSSGAVTVSAAGADDHTGIDGARLYTFKVVATDAAGRRSESVVAAQLDLSQVAPNNNGVCP